MEVPACNRERAEGEVTFESRYMCKSFIDIGVSFAGPTRKSLLAPKHNIE